MKFRSYQLLFVASIALLIIALIKPIINVIEPTGVTAVMDNFSYMLADGTISHAVVALGVVLIAAVAVNAFAVFVSLFSNFTLQKRSSILSKV